MRPKRGHRQEQLARAFDGEILPIWSQRFGKMLLRDLTVPAKAMVLDVACATGYPALEVLRKMDEQGRIIAIDPSSPMLDVARGKAGALSGKRIFFRSEALEPRLPFDDDVYDLVLSNLGLLEMTEPPAACGELARVCKPGGRVVATFALNGTFREFYDIFREVLLKRDRAEALARLDRWLSRYPTAAEAERWFRDAGLTDVTVERDQFALLFKSSREFFFAPVIELGPLADWKEIAGRGQEMQEVFWHVKEAIDAYFGARPFHLSVDAACARGRKPLAEELAREPAPSESEATPSPDVATNRREKIPAPDDNEPPTGEIDLHTGEVVIMPPDDGDDDDL